MGVIYHHAICITGMPDVVAFAVEKATELGLQVLGPSDPTTNNYTSCFICPDGSKEGWSESSEGDKRREQFRDWIGSLPGVDYVEVAYGDYDARVTYDGPYKVEVQK